jgi:gas vesicle protein
VPQEVTAGTTTPFALSNNKARQDLIDRLSSDFVDLERRAKKKALSIFAWTTFAATAFASLATYATNSIENRASTLDEVKTKIVQLQSDNLRLRHDLESTKGDLEKEVGLESKLAAVELELKAKGLMK